MYLYLSIDIYKYVPELRIEMRRACIVHIRYTIRMAVDVLIIGGGGREHALAWKLKQSPRIGKLFVAPGNAGTEALGCKNLPIPATDVRALLKFAEENHIGLTIVGPEEPLVLGVVDLFKSRGLRIFGPTKTAAQVETSKVFGKQLMKDAGIPTIEYEACADLNQALSAVRRYTLPVVVKADGLSHGKGVYICKSTEEAEVALREIFKTVPEGSTTGVLIEPFLVGSELSIHALSDGTSTLMFPPSQDHKRAQDDDMGKNTGGMGAICPVPWMPLDTPSFIEHRVVRAMLDTIKNNWIFFTGMLYPGILITLDGPKVLEFNARFGDPECQVYMRLMKTDLLDLLEACVDGSIADKRIDWRYGFAVSVVLASGGYPEAYKTGFKIEGIREAERNSEVVVFHGGTINDGDIRTAGGRVLTVTAAGPTLKDAIDRAYEAVGKITFEGMHYRRDIGASALKYDMPRS